MKAGREVRASICAWKACGGRFARVRTGVLLLAVLAGGPEAAPAARSQSLALSGPRSPHPPVSPFHAPEDWITIADFRHVTSATAGDQAAYVGTAGGLEILPGFGGGTVTAVTAGEGLPSPVVTAVAFEPRGGRVWVGTSLGLAIYDPFRGDVQQDPLRLGLMSVDEIRMDGGRDRTLGVGTELGYVLAGGAWHAADPFTLRARRVPEREVPPRADEDDVRELPFLAGGSVRGERSGRSESFRVTALARRFDGRLLVGTWGANVFLYDRARLAAEPVAYGLAGGGGGALAWDGERLWFTNAPARVLGGALAPASAPAVPDREGIAWADADLSRWGYAYPGLVSELPSDRVHDIALGGERILFATEGGLAILDMEEGAWRRIPAGLATDEALAVEPAADGFWVGTARGLLAFRTAASGEAASGADSLAPAGHWLADRAVQSLAGDGRELYAGTDRGLFRLAPIEGAGDTLALSTVNVAGRDVRDLVLLPDEVVVATERGVEILPRDGGGSGSSFLVGEGTLEEPPLAIAADARNLWVATSNGVSRLDRGRRLWTDYGLEDGLPALPVLDVLLQGGRYVWFSTPGGATRFDYGRLAP